MQPGEGAANLLYGGDLYKGFLDMSVGLQEAPVPKFACPSVLHR